MGHKVYYPEMKERGYWEIRYNEWAGKLYLFNQAVAINRTGGFFDKFTNEAVFNLDDAANAANGNAHGFSHTL